MTPLKEVRKKKGISQATVAARVGVSQAHISSIESMGDRASPDLAEKIVKVLGKTFITEEQILYPERFQKKKRSPRRNAA